jgi:hypoxanthine-DNA glycosylase
MTETPLKQGLPPVTGPETRVLILGSLPGDVSLARRQYYGHPQNLFWRLMGEVLEEPLAPLAYENRLARLAARGVGLWDVVARARRQGSLDAALRETEANDLEAFVAGLPRLRAVGFNGGASTRIGGAALASQAGRLALIPLPSSSPAYAAMSFPAKAERWSALQGFVLPKDTG